MTMIVPLSRESIRLPAVTAPQVTSLFGIPVVIDEQAPPDAVFVRAAVVVVRPASAPRGG
ncbi:MAG: hypothetical protein CVU47_06400 [Chloroflexi bacterium HGW-Chloroflexi-9]|nr:MAG: hypothetical protein CVU47_06400 [Chloroflexi bacterium HGW-Chloroflexi-9]